MSELTLTRDYVYSGKEYLAGTHEITDQAVFDALNSKETEFVETNRKLAEQKQQEYDDVQAQYEANSVQTGISPSQVEEMIRQAVAENTAKIHAILEANGIDPKEALATPN